MGLTVHELFAQSFIAACSPAFLLENPINAYGDLNGKTLLLHEERREAWERWAVGFGHRTDQTQSSGASRHHVGGGARRRAGRGRGTGAFTLERRSFRRRRAGEVIRGRIDHE
jgi:hypothetical protein